MSNKPFSVYDEFYQRGFVTAIRQIQSVLKNRSLQNYSDCATMLSALDILLDNLLTEELDE